MRIDDAWSALASAIIDRAMCDRQQALERLDKNPCNLDAKETVRETDKFFHSGWCEELLAASGINTDGKRIQEIIDES